MTGAGEVPTGGPGWAYFFDLDGTLVDLVDVPAEVQVDGGLRRQLTALHQATGGAMALISGRTLRDLDALFPGVQLPAAGQHGLERRGAEGRTVRHQPPPGLEEARRILASGDPRLELEDKGLSLALHYRRAPGLGRYADQLVRTAAASAGPGYAVLQGKDIVELKPAGQDKGVAVREFLDEPPFRGRRPIFLGDDVTDEDGFATVNARGGASIKVGAGDTVARWRLRDVRSVRAWLDRALKAVDAA